ncbi:MAG TPA: 6-carboxytetrahydropterin synthase [Bryobacteraceae bacterium]|nr:6-carboxytetrahydropterin synthase [Bryobacteraceae bacterium]
MTRVTRRYKFAASHRLNSPHFSEQLNRELYGKCNNPHGHGHDYVLEVTASGPVDPSTGLVAQLPALDRLVGECVLRDFDHKYVNADLGEFQDLVPTSENIIRVIQERLARHWREAFPGEWPRLDAVRLRETRRNSFESQLNRHEAQ